MNEKVLELVKALAAEGCWSDDEEFNAYEYSGGNFDDAFNSGVTDGRISLAREILELLESDK